MFSNNNILKAIEIFADGLNVYSKVPFAMMSSYQKRGSVAIKASVELVKQSTDTTVDLIYIMLGFVAIAGGLASLQSKAIQAGFNPSFRITQSEEGGGKTRNKRKTNKKKRKTIKRRKTNKRRKVSRK